MEGPDDMPTADTAYDDGLSDFQLQSLWREKKTRSNVPHGWFQNRKRLATSRPNSPAEKGIMGKTGIVPSFVLGHRAVVTEQDLCVCYELPKATSSG